MIVNRDKDVGIASGFLLTQLSVIVLVLDIIPGETPRVFGRLLGLSHTMQVDSMVA